MSPETSVPYRLQSIAKMFVHTSFHVTNNEIMHSYDYVYMGVVKKKGKNIGTMRRRLNKDLTLQWWQTLAHD